ncbi:Uncharacterized protein FWK35_00030679 [Aphis craccivora]|uniref:Uncharacterized protein n=1 Tax=Aphis craccivora TaxID=307492 RepID=A0A6G0XZ30_APHCR|nr:Uncharacterized protein FWK35_00030679 [Aphis craccivora]
MTKKNGHSVLEKLNSRFRDYVALSTQTNNILGHELDSNKIKQLKIGRKIQKDLALELCNMLTEYNEEGFTLTDIKNVERTLDIRLQRDPWKIFFRVSKSVRIKGRQI